MLQTSEDVYEVVLSRIDFVRRLKPFDSVLLRQTFKQGAATLQVSNLCFVARMYSIALE